MKIRLMNMIKIINKKTNEVVVLDKKKKYGWEGLTFPGGKTEEKESIIKSAVREAKEETNLDVENLKLVGTISRIYTENKEIKQDLGFLFESEDFKGELKKEDREGKLFWKNYEEFKKMDNLSESMEDILKIYDGYYTECVNDLDNKEKYFY
ncbi:MAG: NUDIX domain-containing protein [Peptoniphilaceae bacterium]|nr:NUDIX domain-containing protein [Peptoniphilaceae bacterium]MDD7383934.1 NUDIX domain-containing protein [Peptoniphilaceae bacterium]MDY3738077.1 NUDIX domain-containing protein [Peptoniphilaceae bacterium]